MTTLDDTKRLNGKTERRLDSMALVVLLLNDSNIEVPALINETLDELGVVLLSHFKRAKGFTTEQTNEVLQAFAQMVSKGEYVDKQKPKHEGTRGEIEAKAIRTWS